MAKTPTVQNKFFLCIFILTKIYATIYIYCSVTNEVLINLQIHNKTIVTDKYCLTYIIGFVHRGHQEIQVNSDDALLYMLDLRADNS